MDLDPSSRADAGFSGKLTQGTRRTFVKGIAAAGASTMVASAIDSGGALDLFTEEAHAAKARDTGPFEDFNAIAASSADVVEVPEGFRADLLIRYGDQFTDAAGNEMTFGYNNDFLAFFPIGGSSDEGVLFVNHEYPGPFFQNGYKVSNVQQPGGTASHNKSTADIREERRSVGNSFLHIIRDDNGIWQVVQDSELNRRIYGDAPLIPLTGPLAGPRDDAASPPKVGTTANGSIGNCSGGITPWGTALSCEENYDGYGIAIPSTQDFHYGWNKVDGLIYKAQYEPGETPDPVNDPITQTYGYVVEHDPYDPADVGRKHTALGRFRHENTAFRALPGEPFVLYMGDDANNEGVYKFVSNRSFVPGDAANNQQILEAGTLYIAEWTGTDDTTLGVGRTVYASEGGPRAATSPSQGRGRWIKVEEAELVDTRVKLREKYGVAGPAAQGGGGTRATPKSVSRFTPPVGAKHPAGPNNDTFSTGDGSDYVARFATNRPEDVEVDEDGTVYLALTNNRGGSDVSSRGTQPLANDRHGMIRRMVEDGGDPLALTFAWTDWSPGGPRDTAAPGRQGFSSPDNLVFDNHDNVWVVTDISSDSLKGSLSPVAVYDYHRNNAVFMVPRSGPNQGVAFRFANMPIEAEGTGPYFTPDEQTLFLTVQHPGESTAADPNSTFGNEASYRSWWPEGNRTAGVNPSQPLPSIIAITRPLLDVPDQTTVPPKQEEAKKNDAPPTPPGTPPIAAPPPRNADRGAPRVDLEDVDSVERLAGLLGANGFTFEVTVDEASALTATLRGTLPRRRRKGARSSKAAARPAATVTLARTTRRFAAPGTYTVRIKPTLRQRAALRAARRVSARLTLRVVDAAGNARTVSRPISFRR